VEIDATEVDGHKLGIEEEKRGVPIPGASRLVGNGIPLCELAQATMGIGRRRTAW